MRKISHNIFLLPAILLLIAFAMKLVGLPDQLLVIICALAMILVFLVVFLIWELRKQKPEQQKIPHPVFFILSFPIIALHYAGMIQQKMMPLLIYCGMIITVFFYFQKTGFNEYSLKSLASPASYRNFVLQNLLLVILNSPYEDILPDKYYSPKFTPKYAQGAGPGIGIDESHCNYHTSYACFSSATVGYLKTVME